MPTQYLMPTVDGLSSLSWVPVGESTRHESLDDIDGDTSYVKCSAPTRSMIIGYINPSEIAPPHGNVTDAFEEHEVDSITSVRFFSQGRHTGRSGTADVDISFFTPTAGFSQTAQYNASPSSYTTVIGITRTTSDGSNPWTYSDLEALGMKCIKNGINEVRLSTLWLEVVWVRALGNATFFGANF